MLEHGGELWRAARDYDIAPAQWLDLSTGISPWSWVAERQPELPASCWARLPQDQDDALCAAAREYYGAAALPVAGSQAAIQMLPYLRPRSRVALLTPSYGEHAQAWRRAGHQLRCLEAARWREAAADCEVLLLARPNNPDGLCLALDELLALQETLAARGGWLLVDEAFIDAEPAASLAPYCGREGLIVLRSLGKFFGMAGARVGFVLASATLLARLREALGPWTVAGPSRHLATLALRDALWQQRQRLRLQQASQQLAALLEDCGLPASQGCALFRYLPQAEGLHQALALRGILTRRWRECPALRIGLPGSAQQALRLRQALLSLQVRA